jgi:hypothetical protein
MLPNPTHEPYFERAAVLEAQLSIGLKQMNFMQRAGSNDINTVFGKAMDRGVGPILGCRCAYLFANATQFNVQRGLRRNRLHDQ